jgi:hypothetical protein
VVMVWNVDKDLEQDNMKVFQPATMEQLTIGEVPF